MKLIKILSLLFCLSGMFISCSDDDVDTSNSIFDTNPPVRNEFDQWIVKNYITPYNIDLKYRFEDIESDLNYHVTPATYENSVALAKLVKYLWMEVYEKIVSHDFLAMYCPKVMHFVGSPEYEMSGGSMVLGTAEGGLKITLFNVNGLNVENPDPEVLNEWYFKTMHHEFAHILHQTKNYSTDFIKISEGTYTGPGWVNVEDSDARTRGFVTGYASSEVNEDFVETIANYIVKSDEQWQQILTEAGEEGSAIILKKLDMVTKYLKESWNVDIQAIHNEVQERQKHLDELDLSTLN